MVEPKVGHRSIVIGDVIYHIGGGNGSFVNGQYTFEAGYEERWRISNSDLEKRTQKLLTDRIFTLEVFAVPDGYCSSMYKPKDKLLPNFSPVPDYLVFSSSF